MRHFILPGLWLLLALRSITTSSQTFTEVSQAAGINHFVHSPALIAGGAAFFDYDNDGWLDIYITGGLNRDKLYRNNGDGTFTETGAAAGLHPAGVFFTMGVVTGDIDNDGFRDIFVTTWGDSADWAIPVRNILYRNNGDGTFTDIAQSAGITYAAWSSPACMGDYNLDGYLDIYVGNYVQQNGFIRDSVTNQIIGFSHIGYPDNLYLNNGNNTFTDIAPQLHVDNRGVVLGATFTDYDNDHDVDLYVANDFGEWTLPSALYRNEYPLDSFTDVSAASGTNAEMYAMGVAVGDYDEDGDLDYYVTNIGRKVLYRNNGNGTFTDVADSAGVTNTYTPDSLFTTGWGTAFFDYDNDTWLDLFVSNGQIPAADIIKTGVIDPHKLYKNNMDGTFTDVSALEGVSDSTKGRGFITGDIDNDGDLDMLVVVTDNFSPSSVRTLLYRNDQANGRHWLKVKVQGTTNNRDGFGTRVEVHAGGRKFIREIDGGSSHASQNSSIAHFGLDSYTSVDSVVVIWPGGGRFVLPNVAVDQLISIVESGPSSTIQHVFVDACGGDSIFAEGAWQTATGVYTDTFPVANGDSIVITHLTVFPNKVTTLPYVVCEDDSILVNGDYYYTDTTLVDSFSTSAGCDSIVIAEVTMIPWQVAIADAYICMGDSIFAGGAWQTQSGSYYDTIAGDGICNYIVITAVGIIPPIAPDTQQAVICAGDSLLAGGAYQTEAGFYADTFAAVWGCDSIVVTHLALSDPSASSRMITLCVGDSFFVAGKFRTAAGTYRDTSANAAGCDSIVNTELLFNPGFDTTVTPVIFEGDSLFAGGAWQTESGNYMDTFSAANGCDSIVLTMLTVIVGIEDVSAQADLTVYPNPARSNFTVVFSIPAKELVSLKLHDISGKEVLVVLNEKRAAGTHSVGVSNTGLAPGTYLLHFKTAHHAQEVKVILY